MPRGRVGARVSDIDFTYEKPRVSVDTSSNTVEHDTVDDTIITQQIGRSADQVRIDGIVTDDEVAKVDNLVKQGEISVRTERWTGTAICVSTSTDFMGGYDLDDNWLYEYTIDLIEVDETEVLTGGPGGFGGFDLEDFGLEESEPAPNITNFTMVNNGGQLDVSFVSDEKLDIIEIALVKDGGTVETLNYSDFNEAYSSVSSRYEYDATASSTDTGEYTATFLRAVDPQGNDGLEGGGDPTARATL